MVTFDYYVSQYFGKVFKKDPTEFFNAANKAERIVRNRGVNPSDFEESAYNSCVCAIAEFLKQNDEAEAKEMSGITSESVGSYSVSYGSSKASDRKALFNTKVDDILALYLGRSFRLKRIGGAEVVY
jgi:hypothetical protein